MEELTYQVTFVVAETIRATYEYFAFNSTSGFAPPFTLVLSNLIKLATAIICVFRCRAERSLRQKWFGARWTEEIFPFAIPAVLDLISTFVYVTAVHYTSPFLLQAFMLVHVPATAIAHHIWVQEQRNAFAWSSMAWLCLGLAIAKIPTEPKSLVGWLVAIIAGSFIGACSAGSSIWTEKLLKSGDFWGSQVRLYSWGAALSIISYPLMIRVGIWSSFGVAHNEKDVGFAAYLFTSTLLAIFTAGVGIIVAVVLRRRNNLVQLIGTSASVITSMGILDSGSEILRKQRGNKWSACGYILTATSVWLYSRYKGSHDSDFDAPKTNDYEPVPIREEYFDSELANEGLDEAQTSLNEKHTSSEVVSTRISSDLRTATENKMLILSSPRRAIMGTVFNAMTFGHFPKIALPSSCAVKSGALSAAIFLVPSFISVGRKKVDPACKYHPTPTEFLHGLRGFASLFVLVFHSVSKWHNYATLGWNGTTSNLFMQLPWIRVVISGNAMVAVFFVISGFSLAAGPLRQIRSKNLDGIVGSLASSVSRRWVRLFLPAAALTFCVMIQVHIGADGGRLAGEGLVSMPFLAQLGPWWTDFRRIANPFNNIEMVQLLANGSQFAATLWTIPLEFRGSMVVYLLLLGCAKLNDRGRIWFIIGITLYCIYYLHWDLALFLAGVILADLHLRRADNAASNTPSGVSQGLAILFEGERADSTTNRPTIKPFMETAFWILNFVLATYILCTPVRFLYPPGEEDPGYKFIWSLTPAIYVNSPAWDRFWPMVGAIYIVFVIDNCRTLQVLFTNRLSRYLGFISFGLYLVHLPFINTFAEMLLAQLWELSKVPTGDATMTGYWVAFWIGYLTSLVGVFWAADLFARVVDEPSLRLSKWLYMKLRGERQ